MRLRAGAVALLTSLALVLAACGEDSGSSSTTASPVASPAGHTYGLKNTSGVEVPAGVSMAISFDDTTVRVTGLCNQMGGKYTVNAGVLEVTELGSTAMACEDQALMDFETTVGGFLSGSPGIIVAGDVLTLATPDITFVFQEESPLADLPLEGTTWTVTGTSQGDGTQSLDTEPATIRFEGGTAEVFAGCNTGSVTYAVADDTITFGSLGLTKKACDEPAMLLEKVVSGVLTGSVTFAIETTKLSLFHVGAANEPVTGLTLTGA